MSSTNFSECSISATLLYCLHGQCARSWNWASKAFKEHCNGLLTVTVRISLFSCQCYKDLGQRIQAQQMCDAASTSAMDIQTKEVFSYSDESDLL